MRRLRPLRYLVVAIVAILVAGACSKSSPPKAINGCRGAVPRCPANDPFYRPPANLDSLARGTVIRSRAVALPAYGITGVGEARTVLYASTDIRGHKIAASTTVIVPTAAWHGTSSRPLLSYQAVYDSLGTQCEPSYRMRVGAATDPNPAALAPLLRLGWALTIPDYEGPQAQFGVGPLAGRTVLDGITAAQTVLRRAGTPTPRAAIWGYSGGGLATAWAAEIQPSYAPRLRLVGAAEGGVPANLKAVLTSANGTKFSGLVPEVLIGLSRAYPHAGLLDDFNAAGQRLIHSLQDTCNGEATVSNLAGQTLSDFTNGNILSRPSVDRLLGSLELGRRAPQIPIYNYHAVHDELIPYPTDQQLVAAYCRAGVTVDHVPYSQGNHGTVFMTGARGAFTWLSDRFAGKPAPNTC